jgi:hypothetical protein
MEPPSLSRRGWFVSYHVFDQYVKVTFFDGVSLQPLPPVASKTAGVRYVRIGERDFDEAAMAEWLLQSAVLPGWRTS